ncbi:MAG: 50S ribosomal protein L29 [Candidatus Pacebacteria bacterium]|nr:50S ribosomal protein L29 [Candidatus Paceibacterota bacterium]
MQAKEYREQSDNQLQSLIKENKEKLREFRFALTNKQLKDYNEIKKAKKIIAVAKTILRERYLKEKK